MAHAVVVALQQKLQQLLKVGDFNLYFPQLCELVCSWHAFLEDSQSKRNAPEAVEYFEQRVKYLATELLESIDLYELERHQPFSYPINWRDFQKEVVTQGFDSIRTYCSKVMNDQIDIVALPTGDSVESASENTPHLQDNVVDLDNDLMTIKARLIEPPSKLDVVSIVGMGGIGKTTLARQVYDDIYMEHYFYVRAWITVSQRHQVRDMLLGILQCFSQINDYTYLKSNEQLAEQVYKSLKGKRYLIVMDDVWETSAWDDVKRSFPNDKNGSRVILTSRLAKVGVYASSGSPLHYMRCLSVEQSSKLFNLKVFGIEYCPHELEIATKQIVEKCQGLPLAIIVVAGFCSKISRTANCWEEVVQKISSVVGRDKEGCLDLLALSYNHLPWHLKSCFQYLAAFPKDFEISVSRLIKLWIAAKDNIFFHCSEGFFGESAPMLQTVKSDGKDSEEVVEGYLQDLIDRSLIMVKKRTSGGKVKTCEVHDLLHDLILREAWKRNGIYFTKSNVNASSPVASFDYHVLFNSRGFSPSAPYATSFLSFGRDGTVGSSSRVNSFITFTNFEWLTVLDICFQPFDHLPREIWKLSKLRYLALASFNILPELVRELCNLQTLIRYSHQACLHLPGEIWQLNQLRHLYFRKCCYLPYPLPGLPSGLEILEAADHLLQMSSYDTFGSRRCILPCLQTLSYITFDRCKKRVLKHMLNLKKLGIRESEEEFSAAEQMCHNLKKLVLLKQLETLKCFFIKQWTVQESDVFPPTLKKLSLRGCNLPWNLMTIVCMLPKLEVLKLKDYAFQGSEWEPIEEQFPQLKFLLIDGTDLMYWKASSVHFPKLQTLVLRNCYCLDAIPDDIAEILTLQHIELYYCSSSADDSARRIQEEQHSMGNDDLVVRIHKFINPEL